MTVTTFLVQITFHFIFASGDTNVIMRLAKLHGMFRFIFSRW